MVDLGPLGPADPWTGRAPCPTKHAAAVSVTTVDGEHVAWLCPDCDAQFEPAWHPPQYRLGELVHDFRLGVVQAPVLAVLNRETGEFVPLDPPRYVPITDLERVVATEQERIEAAWTAGQRSHSQQLADAHDQNHHGAPFIHAYGCPRCADEIEGQTMSPAALPDLPPFVPDPSLRAKSWL